MVDSKKNGVENSEPTYDTLPPNNGQNRSDQIKTVSKAIENDFNPFDDGIKKKDNCFDFK